MSVVVIVTSGHNPQCFAPWTACIARTLQQDIVLICPLQKSPYDSPTDVTPDMEMPNELKVWLSEFQRSGIAAASKATSTTDPSDRDTEMSNSDTRPSAKLTLTAGPGDDWADWALTKINDTKAELIILPRAADMRLNSHAFAQQRRILAEATCRVLQIRTAEVMPDDCRRILVPAGTGSQSGVAIRWAFDLSKTLDAELTGVYVEPNVDAYAESVGEHILDRNLRVAIGTEADSIRRRVVLGNNVARELAAIADDFDLMVLGVRYQGVVRRWLARGISEDLISSNSRACIMNIRESTPLASRIAKAIDTTFRNGVPQLAREQRVRLVERIQSSSKWDVDFIALICLSTLIATGGLMQGSTAVVIGAMLVAPLMTPLLGAGLSLVQGNPVLLKNTIRTVFRGFLLAFSVAFLIGCFIRWRVPTEVLSDRVTSEMTARGAPGILDLIVAFISGIAAAYATGRPNLLSALPGVAIAAALVPPVSTLGLAAAWGQFNLALGAGLLFLTNIVAIVLGTACSFWAVGVRSIPGRGFFNSPTWRTAVALVMIMIGLGVYEAFPSRRIPVALETDLLNYVESSSNLHAASVEWLAPDAHQLVLHVHSPEPLNQSTKSRIASIVFRHLRPETKIELRTHLTTTIESPNSQPSGNNNAVLRSAE